MYQDVISGFIGSLKNEGLKVTPQRIAVLENLIDREGHRECEEIYDDLRGRGFSVSRATIYRTLDLLVKYRIARKLDIGEGKALYESRIESEHHDHIICTECGAIDEFHHEEIENIQTDICRKLGAHIVGHQHQLFIICKNCQKK
mgnify:CR=1 FL=1